MDMVIANGENAAHGKAITPEITHEFFSDGISVITTGNHIWNNKSILRSSARRTGCSGRPTIRRASRDTGTAFSVPKSQRVCVVNLLGRIFMSPSTARSGNSTRFTIV